MFVALHGYTTPALSPAYTKPSILLSHGNKINHVRGYQGKFLIPAAADTLLLVSLQKGELRINFLKRKKYKMISTTET